MNKHVKTMLGLLAAAAVIYTLLVMFSSSVVNAHYSPLPHLNWQYFCVEEADARKWAALETLDPRESEKINALFADPESSCGDVKPRRIPGVPVRIVLSFLHSGSGEQGYLVEILMMPDGRLMYNGEAVSSYYGFLGEMHKKIWFPEPKLPGQAS